MGLEKDRYLFWGIVDFRKAAAVSGTEVAIPNTMH